MPQVGYAYRPVAYGAHGLAAAAHPSATLAGIEVLKGGGNVVDAALAVNSVLAVVQPHMCGLGGDLFALLFHAPSREVVFLNGAGRYGTRGLGELLKPAVALAADGFPASDLLAQTIRERVPLFEDPEWHRIYAPGGEAPRAGDRLRQPDLAQSLALVAEGGADAFYRGELGAQLVRHVEAGGGFLTPDDLAGHASRWPPPIATTYRGATVWETPPPTHGLTVLQALTVREQAGGRLLAGGADPRGDGLALGY